MKLFFRVLLISTLFILLVSQYSFGQLAFGIKPGATLNSGYGGLKIGNIVVFGGFEYVHGGGEFTLTYSATGYPDQVAKQKYSGNLYVPFVGAKIFLLPAGSIKGYVTATISKPWISASIQPDSGKEAIAYTEYGGAKTTIKDLVSNVNLWGVSAGVGSEYFFSDNFSLGGEFGFRWIHGSFDKTIKTGPTDQEKIEVSAGLSTTYSTITLNYYF